MIGESEGSAKIGISMEDLNEVFSALRDEGFSDAKSSCLLDRLNEKVSCSNRKDCPPFNKIYKIDLIPASENHAMWSSWQLQKLWRSRRRMGESSGLKILSAEPLPEDSFDEPDTIKMQEKREPIIPTFIRPPKTYSYKATIFYCKACGRALPIVPCGLIKKSRVPLIKWLIFIYRYWKKLNCDDKAICRELSLSPKTVRSMKNAFKRHIANLIYEWGGWTDIYLTDDFYIRSKISKYRLGKIREKIMSRPVKTDRVSKRVK
jgi:hypothetical protein